MQGSPCRATFAGLLLVGLAHPLSAQIATDPVRQATDPTQSSGPLFHRSEIFMAGGVLAVTGLLMPLDRDIMSGFQSNGPQGSPFLHHSAHVLNTFGDPGGTVLSVGLWGAGLLSGSHTLKDVGGHATIAIAASGLITALIKGVAGRQRPLINIRDSDEFAVGAGFSQTGARTSFPSGHATAAFAFATVMSSELHRLAPGPARYLGPLLYASAAGVGLARVYDSKHWASDVVLGAGIGTFTGIAVNRIAHRHAPPAADGKLEASDFVPAPGIVQGGFGLTWSLPVH